MSKKKPNEFPKASLPLAGTEEVYSQLGGISERYTVEDIKDYTLAFFSGSTGETQDLQDVG